MRLSDKQLAALSAMVRCGEMAMHVRGCSTIYRAANGETVGLRAITTLEQMKLAKRVKRKGQDIVVPTPAGLARYNTQLSVGFDNRRRAQQPQWRTLSSEEARVLQTVRQHGVLFWDSARKCWEGLDGAVAPRGVVSKLARDVLVAVETGYCARITPQGEEAMERGGRVPA